MVIKGWIANYSFRLDLLKEKSRERKTCRKRQCSWKTSGMGRGDYSNFKLILVMRTKYMEWSVLIEQNNVQILLEQCTLLLKCSAAAFCSELVSLPRNSSERHSESFISIFCYTERNSESCSLPRNSSERHSESLFLLFVTWKGIPSCVLFRRMVRNRIVGVCFYFCSTERIPSYFLFRRRVRNGIPSFSFPRNIRNSVGNNHLFRLFRLPRNYFFVGNSQPYLMLYSPIYLCWTSWT